MQKTPPQQTDDSGLVVDGLTKSYGPKTVVDQATFMCPRGTITGFVGPNGSGKSTTIRMIVGHVLATSGTATFDGIPFRMLPEPGRTVGVLIDASAQHPGRSVQETATLAALTMGISGDRTRTCLAAVGLDSVRRKNVGALSLGMRQRLGLAIALLGSPRYLVLDEPANGLDPEGILWLREFLLGYAASSGTVLISSHQLSEIQAATSRVIVIDRGHASLSLLDEQSHQPVTRVSAADLQGLSHALTLRAVPFKPTSGGRALLAYGSPEHVGQAACAAGVPLSLLTPEEHTLEQAFRETTSGEYTGATGSDLLPLLASESAS
ncbi:ABC transporter [Frondihabitans sucicola]|uniref:ABC transporter n=2 Tax=Frondihabitans sucicola TaxID=1268041 RepID=A0ABM8GTY1_9MICO|nr:ABC transporter [Frondihabitans sucicola]